MNSNWSTVVSKKKVCSQFAVVAAVFLLLHLFGVRQTAAHAEIREAHPAPGAQLAASPPEIRLIFEGTLLEGSTFALFDASFRQIETAVSIDPQRPNELVGNPPSLADDVYTVQWLSINTDGHSLSGSYNFSIGEQDMLESVAFAESVAVNPPAWVAWLMVVLALALPTAAWIWLNNKKG